MPKRRRYHRTGGSRPKEDSGGALPAPARVEGDASLGIPPARGEGEAEGMDEVVGGREDKVEGETDLPGVYAFGRIEGPSKVAGLSDSQKYDLKFGIRLRVFGRLCSHPDQPSAG